MSTDPDHRFELALDLRKMDIAHTVLQELGNKDEDRFFISTFSDSCWMLFFLLWNFAYSSIFFPIVSILFPRQQSEIFFTFISIFIQHGLSEQVETTWRLSVDNRLVSAKNIISLLEFYFLRLRGTFHLIYQHFFSIFSRHSCVSSSF